MSIDNQDESETNHQSLDFSQSRRHWLSSFEFRRLWILGYLVFNTLLYLTQVSLYSLMFLPSINQVRGS